VLFPAAADGDPKALLGGFRVGAAWKRVRALRDGALRLREEERAEPPVRALYHRVEGSQKDELALNFELRDGEVLGVTVVLTAEHDRNRAVIHGLASEIAAWLDAQLGEDVSWCADDWGAYPIDGEFYRRLEKPSRCWWRVEGRLVAELVRRHRLATEGAPSSGEVVVRMRREGLPEEGGPRPGAESDDDAQPQRP
jgi:hypothetical protein